MGKPVRAGRTLTGEIRKDRSIVKAQVNRSPYFQTGMHPNGEGGLDSDNFDDTHGYSFKDNGDAEFNGNVDIGGDLHVTGPTVIGGTLSLPAGIINNDALANPVTPGGVWQTAANFTVATAWSDVISYSLPIPAGFTAASITAHGRITAFYNNAGTGSGVDYLYANLWVGSASSDFYPLAVTDNGGSGTNQVFRDAVFTGLTPGSSINFVLQASTGFNTWTSPSSPGNQAKLGATVQWFR